MPLFDLKKNLIFVRFPHKTTKHMLTYPKYGAYHRDPTNVAIHIACVPMLLATAFVFVRPFTPSPLV
jgi:hypothetical protein